MYALLEDPTVPLEVPEQVSYDVDFLLWMSRQLVLLRAGKFEQLDVDNLLQEMEMAVTHQRTALKSRLYVLIMHLLKYQLQGERETPSWYSTVVEQRLRIELLLENSPSLRPLLQEVADRAYDGAVRLAANETGIGRKAFPEALPFTLSQMLDHDFYP